MIQTHPFRPIGESPVGAVFCADCGKWPQHHNHVSVWNCTCTPCRHGCFIQLSGRKSGRIMPLIVVAWLD